MDTIILASSLGLPDPSSSADAGFFGVISALLFLGIIFLFLRRFIRIAFSGLKVFIGLFVVVAGMALIAPLT